MSASNGPSAVPRKQERLDRSERAELRQLEERVERGTRAYVAMGQALARIRDARLYRETHGTFEDYCRERWGWGRNYANKAIAAAETVASLGTGVPTPASEAVARELAPLRDRPDEAREVWSQAIERHGPQPTAAQVREIVRPPDPGTDARFTIVEDVYAALRLLPTKNDSRGVPQPQPHQIVLPTEDGDVAAFDEAFSFTARWVKAMAPVWREHKRALRAANRNERKLRAVA